MEGSVALYLSSMSNEPEVVDSLTRRFVGHDDDGRPLHELRAAHVAEVLQGVVGLTSDFDKAGVFHDEGPADSTILVRPAQQGSFLIEVVRVAMENVDQYKGAVTAAGVPTIGSIVWWATKSVRAGVKDFDYLENGNVKVVWQDDTSQEVPASAWAELQKRKRRRKKQLRQIMAPLSDPKVTELDITDPVERTGTEDMPDSRPPQTYSLDRTDYDAARPEDDIVETWEIFETRAKMSAIDFDDPTRWRVKADGITRTVTVEDAKFLRRVAAGAAIRPQDSFWLRIREDAITKNGRTRTTWTVLSVEKTRRAADDDDSQESTRPPAP